MTMANAPLGDGTAEDVVLIWVKREGEYFCEWDWTGQIRLICFNKSPFCKSRQDRPKKSGKRSNLLDSSPYIHKSGYMESEAAILALAALAQPTRLDVFKLLVKHEPDGLAAGDIARTLAVPQNTMSSHLSVLSRAGLVSAQRFGRSIVYRADLARFQEVVLFMLRDCCDGRPEICAPLIENLTPCCLPKARRKAHV
jgi:ArsR family transcriptional regulator, arsenate/arsenite/antimonite-responsive transcriptional repressor